MLASPFANPLYVMLKPVGASCNLNCAYCYYTEKKYLYGNQTNFIMSEALLERFIKQYLSAQTQREILFTWHGGEPLLRGLSFYKKAISLQRQYAKGLHIDNSLQTNGTLLNDEWCIFFKENNFLIGISIDGTEHCHNHYRLYHDGKPTFHKTLEGINLLKKHEVAFNIMGTVNHYNVNYPLECFRFFKSIDCHYIQFTPIVETVDNKLAAWNISATQWGDFLIALFDEWIKQDVGTYFIQYFDATLANWAGVKPGICTLGKTCGHAGVMEFNGDVYSCDHFVYNKHKLGNIYTQTLVEMMYSERQLKFGTAKYETLPTQCKQCKYLFACYGECLKNRIIKTKDGEPGLNYLCEGYYNFFEHAAPYMDFMVAELTNGGTPANVMYDFRRQNKV
jgi:uncharacterized protein